MLLTYFLNDFEIVLVAPIITGITFAIIIIIIICESYGWELFTPLNETRQPMYA